MSKRDELRQQWEEYARLAAEAEAKKPEDPHLQLGRASITYFVEDGELAFEVKLEKEYGGNQYIGLDTDQAEKLYQFLGELYG